MNLSGSVVRRLISCLALISVSWTLGCGGAAQPRPKNMSPTGVVKGIVKIDGEPTADVVVWAYDADKLSELAGVAIEPTNFSPFSKGKATTGPDGAFQFTTYFSNDGLPEGNYVLAFFWTAGGVIAEDVVVKPAGKKFNQKYSYPSTSETKFSVTKGKPTDLGTLEFSIK